MTLLNWILAPEGAFVLTDTACRMDGKPGIAASSTKAHPHPRLDLLVAGTGCHPLVENWNNYVGVSAFAEDIEELDAEASQVLPDLWRLAQERGATGTATVYHWGWSPKTQGYVGFAYRSTDGFRSDRLASGAYIKPEVFDPDAFRDPTSGELIQVETLEDHIRIAEIQKQRDRKSMSKDPIAKSRVEDDGTVVGGVGIGGHLIGYWLRLDAGAPVIISRRIHTFADHTADRLNMLRLAMCGPRYALHHLSFDNKCLLLGRSIMLHRSRRHWLRPSTWLRALVKSDRGSLQRDQGRARGEVA